MKTTSVLLASVLLALFAKTEGLQTDRPTNPQKLVPPSAYRNVPGNIRAKLQKHGCYVPETQALETVLINVVSGNFAGKNQLDWAAICVIGDRPQILILWGNRSPACSSEIHSGWPLKDKFSEEPAGGIFLRKATPQRILNYRRAFPAGRETPVTHDGLEVGNEQASLIFYCDSGKWLELRGND